MRFTVAIVGRPNVGKSTLFNRLTGRRAAIVEETPGVTRDWREGEAHLAGLEFRLLDTAGLEDSAPDSLSGRMRAMTEQAVAQADLVLFLIDARAGVTPLDEQFALWLRRQPAPTVLAANKAEGRAAEAGIIEGFRLGFGAPVAISAEHGENMGGLFDALAPHTPAPAPAMTDEADAEADDEAGDGSPPPVIRLAIVGRPNVGKSTLVNRLLGEERMLTGPEAGITRDAVASAWRYKGQPIELVDTAGLRRRARVVEKLERLSAADTRRAIRFAHIVILVLDATVMLERQDLLIARMTEQEGRALIIAANKWDLVTDRGHAIRRLRERVEDSLAQVRGIACLPISAEYGSNLDRLLDAVLDLHATWNRRIETGPLNRWLERMVENHPPPIARGRRVRLRYLTQVKARPPSFAAFVSRAAELPDSYVRYLVNGLREEFELGGVPIRFMLRQGRNPYV